MKDKCGLCNKEIKNRSDFNYPVKVMKNNYCRKIIKCCNKCLNKFGIERMISDTKKVNPDIFRMCGFKNPRFGIGIRD